MNKWLSKSFTTLCIAMIVTAILTGCAGKGGTSSDTADGGEPVELIMTSWRTEDQAAWDKANAAFNKAHPNIKVTFKPVKNTEYDSHLMISLQSGEGEDVVLVRPFDAGKALYDAGYLMELTEKDIPNLSKIPASDTRAFQTEDGVVYAQSAARTAFAFYYNKKIFEKHGVTVPETWDEFFAASGKLQKAGVTPLAQGSKDDWTLEYMLSNQILPNFVNGDEWRLKMLKGEDNFLNPGFVKHLEIIGKLKDYFPKGYEGVSYTDTQQMFASEQAAMFAGGSWEIAYFQSLNPDLEMDIFATPTLNKGDKKFLSFTADNGLGINKATKHPAEAKTYLNWLAGDEAAGILGNEIPGMFPSNKDVDLGGITNPISQKWMGYAGKDSENLAQWWSTEKLKMTKPDTTTLVPEAIRGVFTGDMTPEQGAKHIQDGLASWYEPLKGK